MALQCDMRYCYVCDRCSEEAPYTMIDQHEAMEMALEKGFVFSSWITPEGQGRQVCFCKSCVSELLRESSKG